jgi:hypothetical protein
MTIASVLCTAILSVSVGDQKGNSSVFACNLKAIGAAERPRYNDLMSRLRTAIRNRTELPDGFEFRLNGNTLSLSDIAEWMRMERLCCPFLTLQLSVSGHQTDWWLKLTGSEGVKPLLRAEFPAH